MKPKSNPFVRSLRSPLPAFTIALSAATLSLDSVQAATWNGGTSTDWNTAANWTGGVPSGADAVVTTISPNIATITGTVPNVAQLLVGTGGSTGRVNHTAGTLNVGSWLVLGSGGGNSTYNLTSTTATGGNLTGFGIGDGSLAKTGGGDFYVAENAGTTATLNINTTGGVSSTSFTSIGHGGNGTVNLDAGSFNTNGWLALGANGGTGTLNMSGGTVNQGTVDTGSRLELTNPGSAGNATVNLNGGTLAVNGIVASGSGAGNVLINLNGGTLKANMDNSGFIANDAEIDRINVRNGGVIIDTNGKNIGIGEALLHSDIGGDSATDGGVTKNGAGTLTLTGINTYTGGTIVNNGTLVLGAGGGSGTIRGTLMINAGATTTLNATDALGYNGGTSVTQINVNGGTLNNAVAGNNGYLASLTLTGGSMTSTGGGAFNIRASSGEARSITTNASGTESLISGNVILRDAGTNSLAVTVADGAAANDLLISGIISQTEGTNGITKGGAGTLTLSNANSYQGATVISAGTLQVGNGGTTGSLHASSAITNNAALIYNRTDSFSVSNAMSGTGTLTKQGAGTLTLTGANTHSGATNVSAGTLAISTTASSIGSLTVADGAGLSVKTAAAGTTPLITTSLTLGTSGATSLAFDFAAINPTVTQISTGALSLNGTITLSLAGTSGLVTNNYTLIDYTGTALSNLNNFAATAYTFGHSSGTLTNNAGNTSVDLNVIADSLVWSGAGAQTWTTATTGDGTGPNDWATKNGLAATNFWANDAVEFNDTYNVGAGSVAVTNRTVTITGADVNPSGVTFNNSSGDYTVTGSFGIAGTGVLIKNGSSKVSLNTANSYTGGTTINGGTLAINSATSLGNASGVLTLNNGTLQITANIPTATRNIALGDANSTILVDSGTTYETTGVISGSGALNKTGAGTLTLGTATNTFSGGLFINAGTVSVDSNVRLGGASGTAGAITLNGGTLRYTNTAAVNNTHPITVNAGGSSLDIFGTATAGQNSRVISGAGTLLGSGALTINGDGAIDAAGGSGALVITGANTYNGAITLQNGAILAIEGGGGSALDSAATVTLKNNSEFRWWQRSVRRHGDSEFQSHGCHAQLV
jgi:fibronectin-binding autotransporter adhesin